MLFSETSEQAPFHGPMIYGYASWAQGEMTVTVMGRWEESARPDAGESYPPSNRPPSPGSG